MPDTKKRELSARAPFAGLGLRGVYGRSWKTFFSDLWKEISEDNVFNGAAALGFYLTLAIFPALIFFLGLVPYLPVANFQQTMQDFLGRILPGETAKLIQDTLSTVAGNKQQGILSVGALLTVWAASSGLHSLMQQFNITYDVKEGRPFWKTRLTAFLLVVAFGFLTVGALSLVIVGDNLEQWLARQPFWATWMWYAFQAVRWLFVGAALSLAFATIYYFGPDVKQKFRFVTPGSVLSVALLLAASLAFKVYVENFGNYNATYGSIGAVIVLMLWLNILGFVALLGSEVNSLLEHYSPEGKAKGEKGESASVAA
jgi:membrane protein